jgi:hypothetical protein
MVCKMGETICVKAESRTRIYADRTYALISLQQVLTDEDKNKKLPSYVICSQFSHQLTKQNTLEYCASLCFRGTWNKNAFTPPLPPPSSLLHTRKSMRLPVLKMLVHVQSSVCILRKSWRFKLHFVYPKRKYFGNKLPRHCIHNQPRRVKLYEPSAEHTYDSKKCLKMWLNYSASVVCFLLDSSTASGV